MNEVLTIHLSDTALADYVRRRAETEHRTPDALVEELVREHASAEAVTLTMALGIAPEDLTLLRSQDEDDAGFAQRNASFDLLMGRR